MLDGKTVPYRYRDYRDEPLDEREIRSVLKKLSSKPRDVLRTRDRVFKELGLTSEEPDDKLVSLMAALPRDCSSWSRLRTGSRPASS